MYYLFLCLKSHWGKVKGGKGRALRAEVKHSWISQIYPKQNGLNAARECVKHTSMEEKKTEDREKYWESVPFQSLHNICQIERRWCPVVLLPCNSTHFWMLSGLMTVFREGAKSWHKCISGCPTYGKERRELSIQVLQKPWSVFQSEGRSQRCPHRWFRLKVMPWIWKVLGTFAQCLSHIAQCLSDDQMYIVVPLCIQ